MNPLTFFFSYTYMCLLFYDTFEKYSFTMGKVGQVKIYPKLSLLYLRVVHIGVYYLHVAAYSLVSYFLFFVGLGSEDDYVCG